MSNKSRIEKEINKIYWIIFNKVFNHYKKSIFRGDKEYVIDGLIRLEESKVFKKFCDEFAKELSKKGLANQKGIWKKYYKAAKEKHIISLPSTYQLWEIEQFRKIIYENFKMIKSIPSSIVKVYQHNFASNLFKEVAEGKLSRGNFEKLLKNHGAKNARLIARTETAKLQTNIIKNRAKDLGSIAYIWLASNDKRTRPSHKAMNGVVVFWRNQNEKPILDNMQGDAGEFPNCRCAPQPLFDKDDLTKENYKVYDYKHHKVINMSKNRLIQAFIEGEL